VGPRTGLDVLEKRKNVFPGIRIPDRQSCSLFTMDYGVRAASAILSPIKITRNLQCIT